MQKIIYLIRLPLLVVVICFTSLGVALSQEYPDIPEENIQENEKCFKCHGQRTYTTYNEDLGRELRRTMYLELMIHPDEYYKCNHRNFLCTDCHSSDFETFPHPGEIHMEMKPGCVDCHGGDEDYAHYQFEDIEEEFLESIHSTVYDEAFSCWMCHDPHEYHITTRTEEEIAQIIAYDNAICLNCHANVDKYHLLTDKENPNILDKHEWLPNQALHFRSVRCIECHTEVNDSIMVAHKVLSKEHAVKNCVACHSGESHLMSTLYKHVVMEAKAEIGFVNSVILNEAYVIGANRNEYLNKISIIGFIIVFAVIAIHAVLRIIFKSN